MEVGSRYPWSILHFYRDGERERRLEDLAAHSTKILPIAMLSFPCFCMIRVDFLRWPLPAVLAPSRSKKLLLPLDTRELAFPLQPRPAERHTVPFTSQLNRSPFFDL